MKDFKYPIPLTKEFIKKNLYGPSGRLNSNITKHINIPNEYNWCKTTKEYIYCILNNIKEQPKCYCGNYVSFTHLGYNEFCSLKCSGKSDKRNKKIKKTKLEKYGDENYNNTEKRKETNIQRYGVEYYTNINKAINTTIEKYGVKYPAQIKDSIKKIKKTKLEKYGNENYNNRDKFKNTNLEKYKVDNYTKTNEYIIKTKKTKLEKYGNEKYVNIDKTKKTKLEKYGDENYNNSQKAKQTNLKKYGYENYFESNKFKEKNKIILTDKYNVENFAYKDINHYNEYINLTKEDLYKWVKKDRFSFDDFIKYFNITFSTAYNLKTKLNFTVPNKSNKAKTQQEIYNYIKTDKKSLNERNIISNEIDIWLPEQKLGIEYNGLIFHSQGISEWSAINTPNFSKNYHLNKTKEMEDKGYQLFHIFENEWLNPIKQNIWKSIIDNKIGTNKKIGARKLIIKEVQNKEAKNFLDNNHLQGYIQSKIAYGLYKDNELLSIMTFGKSRFNKNIDWELIRFCNKVGFSVIGGASRLLKYFEMNNKPKSIISYANRRWSKGNLYKVLGFEFLHNSEPNYFYFNDLEILESRNKYQKHKLSKLLENFDNTVSEKINMFNNGYRRIFDSGNGVFIKEY